mgnify:CR=1 FL=1
MGIHGMEQLAQRMQAHHARTDQGLHLLNQGLALAVEDDTGNPGFVAPAVMGPPTAGCAGEPIRFFSAKPVGIRPR